MTDHGRLRNARTLRGARTLSGVRKLVGAIMLTALVWGVFLPALARLDIVQRHIERNEQLGIDPGAKYYTEQPNAALWHERVQQRLRVSTPRE